ncbi:GGDEF domain-containing protein [Roseibium limicola]|uniref:diguanylate cyclase n=1 Tax=Roseibium limicola TaxID=2816037 RepID=A0A939ENZ2_9HYPH|nr:GGDEF domain-containing protein [Roseibium limicola]MBO0346255.1 diguanylate cyclase [Roseibium limicola]
MTDLDAHKRTVIYGDSALSYIKRYTLPALPRAYEFWYTYSAGYNYGLNRAINQTLKENGKLTNDDMEGLYGKFLSPSRLDDRLNDVGGQVSNEVETLVDSIRHNVDATTDYGASLKEGAIELQSLKDADKLKTFVSRMMDSTQTALKSNQALEAQLLESKRQIETLQANLEAIRYESLTDELTTLGNRKHFDGTLEKAVTSAKESGMDFTLLLTDIDHFKKFNDTFGHQTGDQVLRLVALAVKQNCKGQDTACRYGGEEFAVILPHAKLPEAMQVGEKICNAVRSKELVKRSTGENLGRVTISIGIATFQAGDTSETIISRADKALYAAKGAGRNRVCTEDDLKNGPREAVA